MLLLQLLQVGLPAVKSNFKSFQHKIVLSVSFISCPLYGSAFRALKTASFSLFLCYITPLQQLSQNAMITVLLSLIQASICLAAELLLYDFLY